MISRLPRAINENKASRHPSEYTKQAQDDAKHPRIRKPVPRRRRVRSPTGGSNTDHGKHGGRKAGALGQPVTNRQQQENCESGHPNTCRSAADLPRISRVAAKASETMTALWSNIRISFISFSPVSPAGSSARGGPIPPQ